MGTIWKYNDYSRDDLKRFVDLSRCVYCESPLITVFNLGSNKKEADWIDVQNSGNVSICPVCGWWKTVKHRVEIYKGAATAGANGFILSCSAGSLKELDLTDLSIPISEVRSYLSAQYKSRYDLHPRKLELVVGSIFSDLGYNILVTSYSNDNGLDIILFKNSEIVGVQVKRYRASIEIEQIRSLAGALVLAGQTKGIFVTTSSFQRGADGTIKEYLKQGLRIELIDSLKLFEALSIAQVKNFIKPDENEIEFYISKLQEIEWRGGL